MAAFAPITVDTSSHQSVLPAAAPVAAPSTLVATPTIAELAWDTNSVCMRTLTLEEAAIAMACWPRECDVALMTWLEAHCSRGVGSEDDGNSRDGSRNSSKSGSIPSLLEMHPSKLRLSRKEATYTFRDSLARIPLPLIHLRFALLRNFNRHLARVLELIDVGAGDAHARAELLAAFLVPHAHGKGGERGFEPSTDAAGSGPLAALIRSVRGLVFGELKARLVGAAVNATWATAAQVPRPTILIDNGRAMSSSEEGVSLETAYPGGGAGRLSDVLSPACGAVFAQAFRQLSRGGLGQLALLCRLPIDDRGRLWSVKYAEESGIDYGGLFRDSLTRAVEDLASRRVDLFVPCANARAAAEAAAALAEEGGGAELGGGGITPPSTMGDAAWVPNLRYASPSVLARGGSSAFEFVGCLMGVSLRSRLTLPFVFPSIVWKGLTGEELEWADLCAIDIRTATLVRDVVSWTWSNAGGGGDAAAAGGGSSSSTSSSLLLAPAPSPSSITAPSSPALRGLALLAPRSPLLGALSGSGGGGGSNVVPLTPLAMQPPPSSSAAEAAFASAFPSLVGATSASLEARLAWASATVSAALTAYDPLIAAMRRGLYSVAPPRALRLLTAHELEIAVAGKPEVDLAALRSHTDYEGFRREDAVVANFWKVLEGFSNEERSLFVRFAWGRSRLPMGRKWPRHFKIARRIGGDSAMILAHTCFFSIELPPYTTVEAMRKNLLFAIHWSGGILNA